MLDKRLTEETLVNIVKRCTLHDITCELNQDKIPVFSFLEHEEIKLKDIKELFDRLNTNLDEKIQFATGPSRKASSMTLLALYGVNRQNLAKMLSLSYGMSHEPTEWHYFMEKPYSAQLKSELESFFTETKTNANGLAIDPNQVWFCKSSVVSQFSKWGNTALHHGLSYENFPVIECFLSLAKDKLMDIDLGLTDSGGKTPLLLAIKVFAPERLVKQLMTDENYNMADHDGMTPMMLACALRRTRVMKLLTIKHVEMGGSMSEFINQTHPKSGKSLGHFACLTAGTIDAQKVAEQDCVLGVLASAGMDGWRDEKAQWNCVTNEGREAISTACEIIPSGKLCFISDHAKRDDGGQVYLNSKENVERCLQWLSKGLEQPDIRALHRHLQLLELSGTSLVKSIMSGSERALTLLKDWGLDLEILADGKTVKTFIAGLPQNAVAAAPVKLIGYELQIHRQKIESHQQMIELDQLYLCNLPPELLIEAPVEAYANVSGSGLFAGSSEPLPAAGGIPAAARPAP